ncbi:hypothetical protein GCM10010359_01930 [Streptomyces morookaense]|nr:hypothetical protein GCM10010359_01930 [Streptomyces morookaense]
MPVETVSAWAAVALMNPPAHIASKEHIVKARELRRLTSNSCERWAEGTRRRPGPAGRARAGKCCASYQLVPICTREPPVKSGPE